MGKAVRVSSNTVPFLKKELLDIAVEQFLASLRFEKREKI
jgi:hypothetical protein